MEVRYEQALEQRRPHPGRSEAHQAASASIDQEPAAIHTHELGRSGTLRIGHGTPRPHHHQLDSHDSLR